MRLRSILGSVLGGRGGAVSGIAAILLPVTIGTAGLVVEHGRGLVEKVENQRVADLSAFAGAVAYNTTASQVSMIDAAKAVAVMNGIPSASVQVALVTSPATTSSSAVRVTVTTSVTMILSQVIGAPASLAVPAEAFAELRPTADSCILALAASGGGVQMIGGAQLNAPKCVVASNAAISVPCGTGVRAIGVAYNSAAAPSQPCGGIQGPNGVAATIVKKATNDPLAGNADIATARARLATVAALTAPTAPVGPGVPVLTAPTGVTFRDIDLGQTESTTKTQATALGCTATKSGSVWKLNCPAGNHYFNNFTVGGGLSVEFVGTNQTSNFFANKLNMGPSINFGNANYLFMQGLAIGYGGATFGTGALNVIGALTTNSTTTIGSSNVTVTGDAIFSGTTGLTGTGRLWVGGVLTTKDTPAIAQTDVRVGGNFAVTSPAAFNNITQLSVGGAMTIGSYGTMSFGGGTWTIVGGLSGEGSAAITIGAGSFTIGRGAMCNSAQFSLCAGAASLIFAGPSSFSLRSGVWTKGGSIVVLGNGGTTNNFRIGAATNGNAIQISGGSTFKTGDATGVSSVFELGGHLNVANGGGSCTVIGAASQHDIAGSILTAGGTVLGAGVYTVTGSIGIGANGGGNTMCNGADTGLLANGVSMVVGATGAALTGTCADQAFCIAAGYKSVVVTTPTAGTYKRLVVVGPATGARGAYFAQGSSATTLSGLFYFPVGAIKLDGAAAVGNGAGECLQLIGKEITLSGGSLLASTCISGNASGGKVVLVK